MIFDHCSVDEEDMGVGDCRGRGEKPRSKQQTTSPSFSEPFTDAFHFATGRMFQF